jgi:hypothetical protein
MRVWVPLPLVVIAGVAGPQLVVDAMMAAADSVR